MYVATWISLSWVVGQWGAWNWAECKAYKVDWCDMDCIKLETAAAVSSGGVMRLGRWFWLGMPMAVPKLEAAWKIWFWTMRGDVTPTSMALGECATSFSSGNFGVCISTVGVDEVQCSQTLVKLASQRLAWLHRMDIQVEVMPHMVISSLWPQFTMTRSLSIAVKSRHCRLEGGIQQGILFTEGTWQRVTF